MTYMKINPPISGWWYPCLPFSAVVILYHGMRLGVGEVWNSVGDDRGNHPLLWPQDSGFVNYYNLPRYFISRSFFYLFLTHETQNRLDFTTVYFQPLDLSRLLPVISGPWFANIKWSSLNMVCIQCQRRLQRICFRRKHRTIFSGFFSILSILRPSMVRSWHSTIFEIPCGQHFQHRIWTTSPFLLAKHGLVVK